MTVAEHWFATDQKGLRALVADRPKSFIIRELVQNAWDEEGVTDVRITLEPIPGVAKVKLMVSDNAPEGFYDLSHAYTLFAHTRKRGDAEKRGRFNIGEKQVLVLCDEAVIRTTKGSVVFMANGKRSNSSKNKTEAGSVFEATMKMTREELEEVAETVVTFLPPENIATYFNGVRIRDREVLKVFAAKLKTEFANEDGDMRTTTRITNVEVIEPGAGETPMLYEMGLPVCETGDRWHCNVNQRVPLTIDRDSVKPAYMRTLRAEVLNNMHEELDEEESAETWVQEAMTDDRIESEAVRDVVVKQHGEKTFVPVPGDPKANERAQAAGYTPVSSRSYGKLAWGNIREASALKSSVQIVGKTASVSAEIIPETEWTEGQKRVARLTKYIARIGLGIKVEVSMMMSEDSSTLADYGNRRVRFNVALLKDQWFDSDNLKPQIRLIQHEVAHERGGHLEMGYHEALTKIGTVLALTEPDEFRKC